MRMIVDLLMRTGSFETDAARAARAAKKRGSEIERAFKGAAATVTRLVGTFTALSAAAAAPLAALRAMTGEMDALTKSADRAAIPVEQFSALAYAGDLADVAVESLVNTMGRLARSQSDAVRSNTSKQAEAFRKLGIEAANADGSLRSSMDVIEDFADRVKEFGTTPEVLAAGMDIFGRSFQQLIPLLKGGSEGINEMMQEARDLGLVMSEEAGRNAEAFNDNITRLNSALLGLKRQIVAEVLPAAIELTDQFVIVAKEVMGADGVVRNLIDSGEIKEWAQAAAIGVATLAESLVFVAKAVNVAVRSFAAVWADIKLAHSAFGALFGQFRGFEKTLAERNRVVQDANAALLDIITYDGAKISRGLREIFEAGPLVGPPVPRATANPFEPLVTNATVGANKIDQEAKRIQDTIDRLMTDIATFGMTDDQRAIFDLKILGADPEQIAQAQQLISVLEELRAGVAAAAEEERQLQEIIREQESIFAEGQRVMEAMRTPAEDLAVRIERLNLLLEKGAINWDTYARAVFEAQNRFDELQKAANDAGDEIDDFAKRAAENIQRNFGDTLENMMSGNFKNIGKGFKQMIDRMVAEALAAKLTEALFGKDGGGGGLFGNILGNIGAAIFGGAKASGGPVLPERAYLVGEQGPEMFVPNTAGRVIPASETAARMSQGPGVSQVNNFQFAAPTSMRTQTQVAAKVGFEIGRARRLGMA